MQTFVPYSDPQAVAAVLDPQRLGKQRVECLQILNALTGRSRGWTNHPATKMWRGYERGLVRYALAMCRRWVALGYADSCRQSLLTVAEAEFGPGLRVVATAPMPPWLDDARVQISHRSNLVRKKPEHYGPIWPEVRNDLPYLWPVR